MWRVYVERLCLGRLSTASGRVAHMPHPNIAGKAFHVPLAKHVAHQTVTFAYAQALVAAGHNARGVLAAVLQNRQRVVNSLVHRPLRNYSNDTTHTSLPVP